MTKTKLDISELRDLVLQKFPKDSAIYSIFLYEPKELEPIEFVIESKIWLRLTRGKT